MQRKRKKKQICKEKEKRQVHGERETEERQTFQDKDRQINRKRETALQGKRDRYIEKDSNTLRKKTDTRR